MGRDTAGLAEFVASKPANEGLRDMDARMVVQAGDLPVKFGKVLVGGIGVGGAPLAACFGRHSCRGAYFTDLSDCGWKHATA